MSIHARNDSVTSILSQRQADRLAEADGGQDTFQPTRQFTSDERLLVRDFCANRLLIMPSSPVRVLARVWVSNLNHATKRVRTLFRFTTWPDRRSPSTLLLSRGPVCHSVPIRLESCGPHAISKRILRQSVSGNASGERFLRCSTTRVVPRQRKHSQIILRITFCDRQGAR